MTILFIAVMGWVGAWFGGHADDFACKHQEWTARHMQEQVGMPLAEGRKLAAKQCHGGSR